MRRLLVAAAPGLFALGLLTAACSGPGSALTEGSSADAAGLEDLFWERREEARSRYTEADVDFMTGMIAHHAQALVMCRLAPTNEAGPSVATLCARITNAQSDEIALMQSWLRDRGEPVPEIHIDGLELMIHGVGAHHMHMPGMLTRAQIDELAAARGPAFDRLFLRYMIQHHSGAVTMVDDLFATDGAGQDGAAFKLASDIHVDQLTEIARMRQMLDALSGSGPDE